MKKVSGHQKQKITVAKHRNDFFRRFRSLFCIFCDEKLFEQIPPSLIELLYEFRSRYLNLIPADGKNIKRAFLERLKSNFMMFHHKDKVAFGNSNTEISLYNFLTVGFSLAIFKRLLEKYDFTGIEEIRGGLKEINLVDLINKENHNKLLVVFRSVALWHNDIEKCQYWFHYEPMYDESKTGFFHNVYVHSSLPEIKSIVADNIARPAVLFQWAQPGTGFEDVLIKPSSLNVKSPFADIPLKVYIQKHALQRFSERIDCLNIGFAQYFIYLAFKHLKVFYDSHSNLLIEYRYAGKKAGYFRVDIVEGVLLVRTFLFITNSGTPEGQLLEKNTGLQKFDKKYLAMDKLSTFMASDINGNKALLKILDEAGCHCLIELYEIIKEFVDDKGKCISENFLTNYLSKGSFSENLG